MRRCPIVRLLIIVAFLSGSQAAQADLIDGYSPARNDRFVASTFPGNTPPTPNPTFFLSSFDFSGVGWVPGPNGNTAQHVTMVSPVNFVNAQHYLVGGTVAFRGSDGSYHTRTVVGQTQVAGTDISIGTLNSPLPSSVAFYPVAQGPESYFIGNTIIMAGQNSRYGRNIIGDFLTVNLGINGSGPTRTAVSDYDPNIDFDGYGYANPSPPTDEFVVEPGDSGSPTFLFRNAQISFLGHHVAKLQPSLMDPTPLGSADSFLSDYVSSINSALASNGGYQLAIVQVPEPGSMTLLSIGTGLAVWIRRRRAA